MRNLYLALVVFVLVSIVSPAARAESVSAVMMRYPDVSADKIVFIYDNDVWIAPKDGGVAIPLSSPAGMEASPKFSPDGRTIAFTANYDGNDDVYTMPVGGGIPQRFTYHPAYDRVVDFTADGRIVFNSAREEFPRMYYASPTGALPEVLPLAYAAYASFSPDGQWIAFTPWSTEGHTWKRYQGGMATDIWLFNLKTYESKRITDFPGTDDLPMWHGDKIYYLSDEGRESRRNIWVYDVKTAKREQVTHFADFDIKWPSLGPDDIVFQHGDELMLLDLKSLETKAVNISIPGDHPHVRTQTVDVSGYMNDIFISPQGKRIVADFRGDIWTLPAENGFPRDLNRTDGVAEHYPAWSPDGKWIAYFSDKTGEYELYRQLSDGSGKEEQLTHNGKAYRYNPVWSPDSKKIAFTDKTGSYFIFVIDKGETIFVDRDVWAGQGLRPAWAKDSNWLAYTVQSPDNSNSVIKLDDLKNRKSYQVTSDMFPSSDPAFDLSGDFLFFSTQRNFEPAFSEVDNTFIFHNSTEIAFTTLRKDIVSPFKPMAPKPAAEAAPAAPLAEAKPGEEATTTPPEVPILKIDTDGMEARAQLLPIGAGGYGNLMGGDKKVFYIGPMGLTMFDLNSKQQMPLLPNAQGFMLTPDATKMVVYAQGGIYITTAGPGAQLDKRVNTEGLTMQIDPRKEWHQIVYEAWRIYRDFFYDPNMHGVDWNHARDQALSLVKHAANRDDVDYILGEMIGELNSSHTYVWNWPADMAPGVPVGMLGCDFELAKDDAGHEGYRISKILGGGDHELGVRSALNAPGLDVHVGDFLLAVNGVPLDMSKEPYAALAGMVGKTTSLTVSKKAVIDGDARQVLVTPSWDEGELRLRAMIERNRRYVFEKTGGKVGYIYVRNTSGDGLVDLQRQFISQHNMAGLIVDERWNGGGMIPERFIEMLNRPVFNYWARRDGVSWRTPYRTHPGPQVMLINQAAGSGGDAFPYYFRMAGLGKLIGTRTWGGLVGISGNPGLIDGGYLSVPAFGIYDKDGTWAIEGHGVDPDFLVIDDPTLLAKGIDPQLDKGIEVVMDEVQKHPWHDTPKPRYLDRSGEGVPKEQW
jgi:tricorn protease